MVDESQGRYADSEAEATEAISIDSGYFKGYSTRAISKLQLGGNQAAALADFMKVIERDHDPSKQAEAWKQIGLSQQRANSSPEALAAYDKSLAANASDPATHRLRAETLLALNRDQDAVNAFGQYLQRRHHLRPSRQEGPARRQHACGNQGRECKTTLRPHDADHHYKRCKLAGHRNRRRSSKRSKATTLSRPIRNSPEYKHVFGPRPAQPQPKPATSDGTEKPTADSQKPGEQNK